MRATPLPSHPSRDGRRDDALFRLAFAAAPRLSGPLNLRRRACTRRIILQKARRQPLGRRTSLRSRPTRAFDCLEVTGFRSSFIPLAGCFSPFPHGTRALSVARCSPALEGGPPSFPQDFACPAVLRGTAEASRRCRRLRGFHPLWRGVPATSAGTAPTSLTCVCRALQPRWSRRTSGLGCARFARHYSGPLWTPPAARRPRPAPPVDFSSSGY
jgi:hypothetical protein